MPGGANISWLKYEVLGPSRVKTATNTSTTGTIATTINSVTSGNLLVMSIAQESDNPIPNPTSVTSSPSLTWTKRVNAEAASSGNAEIWTATATSTTNYTITVVWEVSAGAGSMSTAVHEFSNADTAVGGATATATAQTAPSVGITTNRALSILVCVSSDFSATDGASRTYRDSATEANYHTVAGAYTGYHYYKTTTTIGTYTEGLTAPSTQASGTAILEVRGN